MRQKNNLYPILFYSGHRKPVLKLKFAIPQDRTDFIQPCFSISSLSTPYLVRVFSVPYTDGPGTEKTRTK